MKHLDRYLQNVGLFLPKAQKEDILKELSENILSKIEDKESELGRPLNESEQDAILKSYGSPMVVASRYGSETGGLTFGRQLISPALFPTYIKILTLNLAIALATTVILNITLQLPVSGTFSRFIVQVLMQSAAVTFVFALLQYHLNSHPDQWDIVNATSITSPGAKKAPRISRLESVLQIIILLILASALQGLLVSPTLIFGPFQLAPIWYQLYVPLMLLQVAGIALASVNLFRPDGVRFNAAAQVGMEIASSIILGVLLVAGHWMVLVDTAGSAASEMQVTLASINQNFFYGLLIACSVSIIQLGSNIRQWNRIQRNQA